MLPETLPEVLQVSFIVGLVIALVFEKWAWFQNLKPEQKRFGMKVLTFGVAVAITAINTFVPDNALLEAGRWYEVAQPLLNTLLYTFAGVFGGSQLTHVAYRLAYNKGTVVSLGQFSTEIDDGGKVVG